MVSPRFEMASSSPFGCVTRRDACTIQHASLQKSIIKDNLNIPISTPNHSTQKPTNNADTWVIRVAKNKLGNLSFSTKLHNICRDNKDDSSLSALMSPRHSKIVDRWAATARQQAQEMVTTLENNKMEAMNNFPSRSSSFKSIKEVSPPCCDTSFESEIANLGASSLVRIWEKRLNNQLNNCPKPNTLTSSGRTSSNTSSNESAVSIGEQCSVSEEGTIEPPNEESFLAWEESDNESCSSPKVQSTTSDTTESKRGRVANIIKRLTITDQMQSSTASHDHKDHELCNSVTGSLHRECDRASIPKQQELRTLAQVISSPIIRGRQAFNDLLMQFESDRHGELHNLAERGAVSRFTQRGRIQSLLRLRLLQRGVTAYDQPHQKLVDTEVNRQQGSAIMQLREIFNRGHEPRTSTVAEVSNPRKPSREIESSVTQSDNFPTSNWISKDTRCKIAYDTSIPHEKPTLNYVSQTSATNNAHPSSNVTFRGTFFEAQNDDHKETIGASSSMADSDANEMVHKVVTNDQQCDTTKISYDEIVIEEEATDPPQYASSSYDDIVEEEEASEQDDDETSYDWISDISRPRSYWEELRQERYREKLNLGSENDEIRKLLERRTVSTFLSSGFCERLDRLIMSHMGPQTKLMSSQCDEQDREGSMDQLRAFFQERLHFRGSDKEDGDREQEKEERRNEEEEEEEQEEKAEEQEESTISGSDHEGDYFNQSSSSIHAPSPSSWSYRDNDVGDDSDRLVSMPSPSPSQSQSQHHHSIEMEFIYEMRGQMDQLFHEMSELRNLIKSCMDMQMKMQLQQSKDQEVHTVKEEENKFPNRTPKKGNCCICREQKVNSLLYRCGHMCACLKCANELQWNSGKCPICQAPIIDVVRVYAES
ncbi:hypothetical protein VNO77_01522 [Canavalia gladiata]|uniref:RING-type domain-containing protein n=1 Tax=Canavalia gladiata TaxID=3824 RepID=A0AAN9MT94_CANGL